MSGLQIGGEGAVDGNYALTSVMKSGVVDRDAEHSC